MDPETATPGSAAEDSKGYVYTKEQTLELTVTLPEIFAWPEGSAQAALDGNGYVIRAGQTDVVRLENLPEGMDVAGVSVKGSTMTIKLTRTGEKADPETGAETEMDNLDLDVTVLRDGLTQEKAGTGDIQLTASLTSESWTGTEDKNLEDNTKTNGIEVAVEEPQKEEAKIEVTETNGKVEQALFWVDRNDQDNTRPSEFKDGGVLSDYSAYGRLTFTLAGEDGKTYGPYPYSEELYEKFFGEATDKPEVKVAVDSTVSGKTTLTASGLPSAVTYTYGGDFPGETETSESFTVSWDLRPQDPKKDSDSDLTKNYDFLQVTRDDLDNDRYEDLSEPGWYYVQKQDITFDVVLRTGTDTPVQEDLDKILSLLTLHVSGNKNYDYPLAEILGDDIVLKTEIVGNIEDGYHEAKVTISGAWKYEPNGKEMLYWLTESGEPDKAISSEELDGLDMETPREDGDYLGLTYDNSSVPNYGSIDDKLYSGGTLYLTLKGIVDFWANKEWKGGDPEHRPTATLELWRYRASEGYKKAAPVRDEDGNLVQVKLDGTQDEVTIIDSDDDPYLGRLPKYDTEGHRYIYVFRETLEYEAGDDPYEQVLGKVTVDENGNEVITDQ